MEAIPGFNVDSKENLSYRKTRSQYFSWRKAVVQHSSRVRGQCHTGNGDRNSWKIGFQRQVAAPEAKCKLAFLHPVPESLYIQVQPNIAMLAELRKCI